AFGIDARLVEDENVLHRDDLALHARELAEVSHLAGPVRHSRYLNNEVNRRGDLFADGPDREVETCHQDHVLDTGKSVSGGVSVDGANGAFVTGVHRLHHVEGFRAADLADDYPVGAHTQGVPKQVALS